MKKYIFLLFVAIACLVTAYLYRTGYFRKTENKVALAEPAATMDIYKSVVWPLSNFEIKDTGILGSFNRYMKKISRDTLIVFRYNMPECMSCMEFIHSLCIACQKNFSNVIILSAMENPRAVKYFEKETNNQIPIYNSEKVGLLPFEKVSDAYIFLFIRNNNMASCFFVPEKQNERYNEKMINTMLGRL